MKNKRISGMLAAFLLTATVSLAGTVQTAATVNAEGTQTGAINTAYMSQTYNSMKDNFSVKNTENYIWTDTTFSTVDTTSVVTNDYLKSTFAISDEGIAEGETIFDMTYTVSRNTTNKQEDKIWGVGFGLSETDVTVSSSANAVAFTSMTAIAGSSVNNHLCVYYTRDYTLNVKAVATAEQGKGVVTAAYTCAHCGAAQTVEATLDVNGYFAFGTWGAVEAYKDFTVKNLSFTGNTTQGAKTVSNLKAENFNVVNNSVAATYTWTDTNFETTNVAQNTAHNPLLLSDFEITDTGVATGEKVFEMTYSIRTDNTNKNVENQWGLGFGLSENDTAINVNKAIGFNTMNFYIYGNTYGSHLCEYHNNWRTMTIAGYAGGKLEVTWLCSYCNAPQTFTVEGVDFNGRIAFGSWGKAEGGKYYRMVDFTYTGNAPYSLENGLVMDGASIRISSENSGLRFTAKTPVSTVEELSGLGTVEYGLIYKDTLALGDNVLTLENYESVGAGKTVFTKETTFETVGGVEYARFNFAFYNIPAIDYVTARTVRFYAKVTLENGEVCVFYSDMISRSIDYVATEAYGDRKASQEGDYVYLTDEGDYSYMTKSQLAVVKGFMVED